MLTTANWIGFSLATIILILCSSVFLCRSYFQLCFIFLIFFKKLNFSFISEHVLMMNGVHATN